MRRAIWREWFTSEALVKKETLSRLYPTLSSWLTRETKTRKRDWDAVCYARVKRSNKARARTSRRNTSGKIKSEITISHRANAPASASYCMASSLSHFNAHSTREFNVKDTQSSGVVPTRWYIFAVSLQSRSSSSVSLRSLLCMNIYSAYIAYARGERARTSHEYSPKANRYFTIYGTMYEIYCE